MKKLLTFFCIIIIFSACSKQKSNENNDINVILMSLKDYSCTMQIESFSNKNTITYCALQNYKYPETYSMEFDDDDKTKISYDSGNLYISCEKLNISKSIKNYQNLNQNPLFLSYFLNSYFNISSENILTNNSNEVSIIFPSNNPYLYKATLTLENNLPNSLTYFDKNETPKVNIIYNEFKSESL